jgi:hypothetical protein
VLTFLKYEWPIMTKVLPLIADRSFEVRREDIKKLLLATRSKVFILHLIAWTCLSEFRVR